MKIKKNMHIRYLFGSVILCLMSVGVFAETRIAILDFELKDLTLAPRIPAEIKRTASIKPLLEAELKKAAYVIIDIICYSLNLILVLYTSYKHDKKLVK